MLNTLKSDFLRLVDGDADGAFETPVPGLFLSRSSERVMPNHRIYRPALCVVLQGGKAITLGDTTLQYGEMQALVVALEVPALGSIVRASRSEPYLGLTLEFDIGIMREVMSALHEQPMQAQADQAAIFVQDVDEQLASCVSRILRLATDPKAIPVLYPAIMREISYWLMTGPHAADLTRVVARDSHARRITEALRLLRQNYARTVRVEELAASAGMSPSAFHKHFKDLTAMTPLQYQKQLRLLEARRLMQSSATNVAGAAYEVGYESASQFSREYARMFGAPPKRDVGQAEPSPAY